MTRRLSALSLLFAVSLVATPATAQPLGTFVWQLAPYCNVVTLNTTQDGAVYTFDGTDNQCGASTVGMVRGLAVVNPNGTVGIGLAIVTSPGGLPVHVQGTIDLGTLGGPWTDDHGNSGTFVFAPAAPSGSPRPLASAGIPTGAVTSAKILDGTVAAVDVNAAEVQRRVVGVCATGQLMTAVNQDGTVVCSAVSSSSGGDITSVIAGAGLTGGAASGAVTLDVVFAGSGTAGTVARSDHTHERVSSSNTIIGSGAAPGLSGLSNGNTVIGGSALAAAGVTSFNTALGWNALRDSTANNNTAVGSQAARGNVSGVANAAFGTNALRDNIAGMQNTAVGQDALAVSGGGSNVAVGAYAFAQLAAGDGNIAVGASAGGALTSGGNNIYVGHAGATTENTTTRIGTSQTRAFMAGIRGRTTGQNDAVAVVIDSAGQLGTVSSSAKTKFDIQDLPADVTSAVSRLRPVSFRYKQPFADGSTPVQYGLIAEEVEQVLPELVAYDEKGEPATVKYHVLPSLLLAEVQRLQAALDAASSRTATLEAAVAELRATLAARER